MAAYEDLLNSVRGGAGLVQESPVAPLPDELRLQALWFAGQMGREFVAVDGRAVRVVQFGIWNRSAGPDFLHAVVEIDGVRSAGPLEIDHQFSDWESHGHSGNASFNEVVLHVVFSRDAKSHFTRTLDHREVPQVVVTESVLQEALGLPLVDVARSHPGRCSRPLSDMDVAHLDALMVGAAQHRAKLKAQRKSRTVEVLGADEVLWQALAETVGYRPNRLAMTLLAQRLPVHELVKQGEVAESILFGASGFLSSEIYDQAPPESREYLRGLWECWWRVRDDFEPVPERRIPWAFSGIRPVNHPQRRLSCLAEVLRHWREFKKSCKSLDGVAEFLAARSHPYWSHHYTVKSKRSERKLALIGQDRIRDFQINHLLPERLAADDRSAWDVYFNMPASALSERVDNASVRLFGNADGVNRRKSYLRKAWQHQALLQIYQDFCLRDVSDCEDCPFPEQLAQWRG